MSNFNGFSPEVVQFFADIKENNNREWFETKKPFFKKEVQSAGQKFVEELGDRLIGIAPSVQYDTRLNGSGSIMRIYRDVRFSKDKSPYKTNMGIVWWEGAGKKTETPGFYFNLDADGAWFGGGLYMFPKPFMVAYREAVAGEMGAELREVMAQIASTGNTVDGAQYARVPRGYDKDHPNGDLLKYKGMTVSTKPFAAGVLHSAELVDACFERALEILPLQEWLSKVYRTL